MKKLILYYILIFFGILSVSADNLRSIKSSNNFVISRNLTFNAKNIQAEQYAIIRDIVTKHAGTIVDKFSIKKIAMPSISIKHCNRIPGTMVKEAFQIDISDNSVKIRYTTLNAAQKAVETLTGLVVVNVNGEKCFQGGKYIWTDDSNKTELMNKSHMATEIRQLLAGMDKMAPGSKVELIIVTPTDWMMEANSIVDIMGNNDLYSKNNGYVQLSQLQEVIQSAEKHGIILAITMHLQEENIPLLESTGHSIYSVEGMRFLRSALSEWHEKSGLQNITITTDQKDDYIAERFRQFLADIAPLIGITIN